MAATEREMKAIISAIDQTLMKAEYSVDGKLLSANKNHTEIMGYEFRQMRGNNILTFIPDEEFDEFRKVWESVQAGESSQITVKRKNQATGEILWLLNQYTPVRNKQNQVFKILYIAIDITKQKINEQQMIKQEQNTKKI